MEKIIIKNATIVNEGEELVSDILISDKRIEKIAKSISLDGNHTTIDAEGMYLIPGVIDDQVHFREPGLTHKAEILTESKAAALGGVTSFMEMPNTNPPAFTLDLLEDKYKIAEKNAYANYSFFLGTSNDNVEVIKSMNPKNICGVKIFMGSSTGNLLVDDEKTLSEVFKNSPTLIATHCEDEATINRNKEIYKAKTDPKYHPIIRSREACILSSQKAISLAKKFDTRLHILHISTAEEVQLFDNTTPLKDKKITSEACVHHLWFEESMYEKYGSQMVCNPAIKSIQDREAIWDGLLNKNIDIIATDHAPHTWEEKSQPYPACPSGVPLVQHTLLIMLEQIKKRNLKMDFLVDKMCHNPAICFKLKERGFIREGYFADLVLINPNKKTKVTKDNIAYKCNWSPFEGHEFGHSIDYTIINGTVVQKDSKLTNEKNSMRLEFER